MFRGLNCRQQGNALIECEWSYMGGAGEGILRLDDKLNLGERTKRSSRNAVQAVGEGGETDILNGRAFRLKVLGYLDGMPFTGVESPSSVQKQPFNGERFRRIDFGA